MERITCLELWNKYLNCDKKVKALIKEILPGKFVGIEAVDGTKKWISEKERKEGRIQSANFIADFSRENNVNPFEVHNTMKPYFHTQIVEGKTTRNIHIPQTQYWLNLSGAIPINNMLYLASFVNKVNPAALDKYYLVYERNTVDVTDPIQNSTVINKHNKTSDGIDWKGIILENKQVIFTGAPGTGKTYNVRKAIRELINSDNDDEEKPKGSNNAQNNAEKFTRMKFVQFHSSYDYSDFVEGLRPVRINNQNTFVRMDGIFKSFCRTIVEYNLKRLKDSTEYSCYGTIESLRDVFNIDEDADDEMQELKGNIKRFIDDEDNQFFFIIDEINRADIGRVCGELMFGLEESYRGVENRFSTQYSNLDTYVKADNGDFIPLENDVFKAGFFVPENIHIIGTMNDIDRSVESFDYALRRRFQWVDIKAQKIMKSSLEQIFEGRQGELYNAIEEDELLELIRRVTKLNNVVSNKEQGGKFGLSEAFHIGPAYFKDFGMKFDVVNKRATDEDDTIGYAQLWTLKLEPILREYVRGREPQSVAKFMRECADAFGTIDVLSEEFLDRVVKEQKNPPNQDEEQNNTDTSSDTGNAS